MRTSDFDFHLPQELIAQLPAAKRDDSRLLVLHRDTASIGHETFRDVLNYFRAGDVLVLNNSRVIPARLRGNNSKTGGAFEILLLEENSANDWWAMMKPGKRAKVGTRIQIGNQQSAISNPTATVTETNKEGHRRLRFNGTENILNDLDWLGELPLPPYIERDQKNLLASDKERYQTVFSKHAGSVAAPTAGLHFTEKLLEEIRALGVEICFVTLHVGLGTFAPVKAETLAEHIMHEERYEVGEATAKAVNKAKSEGRRVIAVGTTSVRVLESAAQYNDGRASSSLPPDASIATDISREITRPTIAAGIGRTKIFIHPPRTFKIVDGLLTNFHLPCSTLLMLVSAFTSPGELRGRETILYAYAEAVRESYRFFSYGDAMLIL